jgi:hypothetical protein
MTRTGKSLVLALALYASALIPAVFASGKSDGTLDGDLATVLSAAGFTGQIEQTFQTPDLLHAAVGQAAASLCMRGPTA